MCGRFTQAIKLRDLHRLYRILPRAAQPGPEPRYNGCPTQSFVACRLTAESEPTLAQLRWGLVPSWAPDPKIASRLINARAETPHEKPAFRTAFKRRRCLIPADGWFEWRSEHGPRLPYFVSPASGGLISFAGLWESWRRQGEEIESFTIITTAASSALRDLHHRQPSIIDDDDFDAWLSPATPVERALSMVRKQSEGPFDFWPVSRDVNNPRNDDPSPLQRQPQVL